MSKLSLSNTNIKIDKLLTVKEILKEINYDYNELYIDKFWDSIKEDKWVYIDNNMIKWMGYGNNINSGKINYIRIITNNFKENVDYKLTNSKKFTENAKSSSVF